MSESEGSERSGEVVSKETLDRLVGDRAVRLESPAEREKRETTEGKHMTREEQKARNEATEARVDAKIEEVRGDFAEEKSSRERLAGKWDQFEKDVSGTLKEINTKLETMDRETVWEERYVRTAVTAVGILVGFIALVVSVLTVFIGIEVF